MIFLPSCSLGWGKLYLPRSLVVYSQLCHRRGIFAVVDAHAEISRGEREGLNGEQAFRRSQPSLSAWWSCCRAPTAACIAGEGPGWTLKGLSGLRCVFLTQRRRAREAKYPRTRRQSASDCSRRCDLLHAIFSSVAVVIIAVVMPVAAGLNNAAGEQPAGEQQCDHCDEFHPHGVCPQ